METTQGGTIRGIMVFHLLSKPGDPGGSKEEHHSSFRQFIVNKKNAGSQWFHTLLIIKKSYGPFRVNHQHSRYRTLFQYKPDPRPSF